LPAHTLPLIFQSAETAHANKFDCHKLLIFFNGLQSVIHSLFTSPVGDRRQVGVKRIISENFKPHSHFHIRGKRVWITMALSKSTVPGRDQNPSSVTRFL